MRNTLYRLVAVTPSIILVNFNTTPASSPIQENRRVHYDTCLVRSPASASPDAMQIV